MDTTNKAIIDAGVEYTIHTRLTNIHPVCIPDAPFEELMGEFNRNYAFEAGAEWMLERACEWIKSHIDIPYEGRMTEDGPVAIDYINYATERLKYAEEVVNAFRKSMEK
jgi:hypothetical protein